MEGDGEAAVCTVPYEFSQVIAIACIAVRCEAVVDKWPGGGSVWFGLHACLTLTLLQPGHNGG